MTISYEDLKFLNFQMQCCGKKATGLKMDNGRTYFICPICKKEKEVKRG